jgi:hypothetical protein
MVQTICGVPSIVADDGAGFRFTLPSTSDSFYIFHGGTWEPSVNAATQNGTNISVTYDDNVTFGPTNSDRQATDIHPVASCP